MRIIVQKYGGTSTRNRETRSMMYDNIIDVVNAKNKAVVVVSAMGRYDDPYATDTLLSVVRKKYLNDEEIDRLSSIGETLATLVIKSELASLGYRVASVSNEELGIMTDDSFTCASIEAAEGEAILKKLEEADIVIAPGFQGHNKDHVITTLGRGGSDLSAVAIGAAIGASEVEIYSDVDGIYTADPRIVPRAMRLDMVSYEEMLELSNNGAKVLNHRCVVLAAKTGIKIHCCSSFRPGKGTYVVGEEDMKDINKFAISGITGTQNEARFTLVGVEIKNNVAGILFKKISEAGVNVNVYNQALTGGGHMDISIITQQEDIDTVLAVINSMKQELQPKRTIVRGNIGKVAVVGLGIRNRQGMFEKVYNTLENNNIHVEMASCSEINISCYIDRNDVNDAQVLLHEAFIENNEED